MSGAVLVVLEQQSGKIRPMSWEALAAGVELAGQLGVNVEAAVVGKGIAGAAASIRGGSVYVTVTV